jgi:hypothetical protein
MTFSSSLHAEIDQWFRQYFRAFIDISAGRTEPEAILRYWGVPLHTSNPLQSRWLRSAEEVVHVLRDMQEALKKLGYTHTVALDQSITIYHERAGRVETIMSRRRGDGSEVDRAEVAFEVRRTGEDWTVISTSLCPTSDKKLNCR